MSEKQKFDWTKWRNKWVFYKGKKIKVRNYIALNALIMKQMNKPKWFGVNHYHNYKIALSRYGLPGIKHYENLFYKNIPMPYNRLWYHNLGLWINKQINNLKNIFK